ncbi:hypothetical protein GCM10022247_33530 [Allokutzneria multivorans]|uniref:Uncharacterized protein n=1 Tax=Allokutzneria multivorans TaxID=1142134 RepID=A0ABP7S9I2_9PSEU
MRRRLLISGGVAVGLVGLVSGPYASAAPVAPAESCSSHAESGSLDTDAIFTITPNSGNAQYSYFYPGAALAAAPATFPGSTLVRDSHVVRGGLGTRDDCPKECRDEHGRCKQNCGG